MILSFFEIAFFSKTRSYLSLNTTNIKVPAVGLRAPHNENRIAELCPHCLDTKTRLFSCYGMLVDRIVDKDLSALGTTTHSFNGKYYDGFVQISTGMPVTAVKWGSIESIRRVSTFFPI